MEFLSDDTAVGNAWCLLVTLVAGVALIGSAFKGRL
jgi:hypothetical protein